jgi:hypothetical protein
MFHGGPERGLRGKSMRIFTIFVLVSFLCVFYEPTPTGPQQQGQLSDNQGRVCGSTRFMRVVICGCPMLVGVPNKGQCGGWWVVV